MKGKDGQAATVKRGKTDVAAFPIHPGQLTEYANEQKLKPFRRWKAYSQKLRQDPSLVVYYTFESRGRDSTRPTILPNVAATVATLDGRLMGPRWVEGRFFGKYALRFSGPDWSDRVELPEPKRFKFTGPFTVAVWFQIERFTTEHQALITKGDTEWRVQRTFHRNTLCFHTNYKGGKKITGSGESPLRRTQERSYGLWQKVTGSSEIANRQWHLVVVVWAPTDGKASKRLYLDGRLDAEGQSPLPFHHNRDPVWIGNNCTCPDRVWDGLIDEVAIFSRALSDDEIGEMYDAGKPAGSNEPLFMEDKRKNDMDMIRKTSHRRSGESTAASKTALPPTVPVIGG